MLNSQRVIVLRSSAKQGLRYALAEQILPLSLSELPQAVADAVRRRSA